jgi:hypothetical protein
MKYILLGRQKWYVALGRVEPNHEIKIKQVRIYKKREQEAKEPEMQKRRPQNENHP